MVYLESFHFPTAEEEDSYLAEYLRAYMYDIEKYEHLGIDGNYPFRVLSNNQLESLDFEPITILYGGNGSGKSTALNVIAERLNIQRNADYNRTIMSNRYVEMCDYSLNPDCLGDLPYGKISSISKMITSDDIFKTILGTRGNNDRKHVKKNLLMNEITAVKMGRTRRSINLENDDDLKEIELQSSFRKGSYVQNYAKVLGTLQQEHSNGETGMSILAKEIENDGLYLLDEPENSMSCVFQQSLAQLIQTSAATYNMQFIIATHAPFLLAIPGAKIYNLDTNPVTISHWYELENMQKYFQLFDSYSDQFKEALKYTRH